MTQEHTDTTVALIIGAAAILSLIILITVASHSNPWKQTAV